ncbi:MAG: adenylosuccinate lyase [Elusimicrobia bacterium]|nr:adenylosuccinate lyase [Elusimicrobiota bacterium]
MIERYQHPEITRIFSDENRFRLFLRIEVLLLEELARSLPIKPVEIARLKRLEKSIDVAAIREQEARTRHEITAFLNWVFAKMPGAQGVANYLHFGLTSNDLMDTALAVQMKEAADVVLDGLDRNLRTLEKLALRYRNLPVIARTHGIHAEVTSLGFKFLSFLSEGRRTCARFEAAHREIACGKLSGSVGNFASSAIDPATEERLLAKLGLSAEPAATQVVARDRHAVVLARLAIVGGWVERIAVEIRHGQRTEVAELSEPFAKGQHGSSSMPHKKNPILTENLCGLARLLRGYAAAALENMALWHERDISHSSAERVMIPDAFHAAAFMMKRLNETLSGLVVNERQIEKNLALLGDLTHSQAYLNVLIASGVPRKSAYSLIQAASLRALNNGGSLFEELVNDAHLPKGLKLKRLTPEDFLCQMNALYARAFKKKPS